MSQSKLQVVFPIVGLATLGGLYTRALQNNPLVVKAITSGCLSALGNIIGQQLQAKHGEELRFIWRAVASYGIFGFFIAGPGTHFWLNFLQRYGPSNIFVKLFLDRFTYGAVLLLVTLYVLSILQGTSHGTTVANIRRSYGDVFKANLKIFLVCQYINFNFVPLQFRTLFSSLVALGWNIYLSSRSNKKKNNNNSKPE